MIFFILNLVFFKHILEPKKFKTFFQNSLMHTRNLSARRRLIEFPFKYRE